MELRRTILLALALALTTAGLVSGARADDRAEIDALYAKLEQALKNKTPEATLALETPDFTAQGEGGKTISGKKLVEQMRQQNAAVQSIKDVKITVKKAVIAGKTAKVTTNFSYAVMVEDKDGHMGPKGESHEMALSGELKNDLVKTAAGWRFKTMNRGTGKMLIDGRPVQSAPPSQPGKTRKR